MPNINIGILLRGLKKNLPPAIPALSKSGGLDAYDCHQDGGSAPQLFSVKDTASILAISERQVRHWIETGHLTCVRLGRSVRLEQREIERLIDEGRES